MSSAKTGWQTIGASSARRCRSPQPDHRRAAPPDRLQPQLASGHIGFYHSLLAALKLTPEAT
ncbi:MAG: hypothetical protein IPO15_03015 [Anaerolineae bacterium]|uniref:hypothetical protein n=1 Tax=Candidatus Amarolinea dominans TaxID=3140696 RepID=UPI0031372439|nr:hypothetical protein [Anaerolineae bacterium]